MSGPLLLSVAAAAQELGVSRTTAYRWIQTGELPAVRLGGRLRIRRSDLDELTGGEPARVRARHYHLDGGRHQS